VLQDTSGNHIAPFLWVHGEDHEAYRETILAMHKAGIGALCTESRPFMPIALVYPGERYRRDGIQGRKEAEMGKRTMSRRSFVRAGGLSAAALGMLLAGCGTTQQQSSSSNQAKWLRTSGITAGIPVAAPLHHMDERLMHPEDRGTRWRRVMQAD